MRRMKGSLCALALVLALPTGALAVTEGVVEEAPGVELEFFADAGGGQLPMNDLIERGREVASVHLGQRAKLTFREIRVWTGLAVSHDVDGNEVKADSPDAYRPVYQVRFYYTSGRSRSELDGQISVVLDQETGCVLDAEDYFETEALYPEDGDMLPDEEILAIAGKHLDEVLGFSDYAFDGAPVHRGGTSVCPRIVAANGDRLGLRMDGVTGKIYALELYSLGEERSK